MSQNLFQPHLIDNSFKNVYGLEVADINGDGRKDVIAGSTAENIIAWYEAPTWKRHTISTRHSGNITISAHDINRDGKVEIAVGSGFNAGMNSYEAYLQWLEPADRPDGEEWKAYKIDDLPFVHRIKFADIDGDGEKELVAGSIRGATGEKLDWSHPGMLVYYKIPPDPRADIWPKFTIDANLKKHHATLVIDFDDDGHLDILVGCLDGIIWYKYKPIASTSGSGRSGRSGRSGSWQKQVLTNFESSEVFPVNLSGGIYKDLLSIEPWHGNQLVWYKAPDKPKGQFERFLIDDGLNRGHTLAALDVDNDGKVEVIAGYNGEGTSLYVYRPVDLVSNRWEKELIDDGLGVGISVFEDLNLDGKIDFACSGLSSHNIKWYENVGRV